MATAATRKRKPVNKGVALEIVTTKADSQLHDEKLQKLHDFLCENFGLSSLDTNKITEKLTGVLKGQLPKELTAFIVALRNGFDVMTVAPEKLKEQYPELGDYAAYPCECKTNSPASIAQIMYHLAVDHEYDKRAEMASFVETALSRHREFAALRDKNIVPTFAPEVVTMQTLDWAGNITGEHALTTHVKELDFRFKLDDRNHVEAHIPVELLWKFLALHGEDVTWYDPEDYEVQILDIR